MRFLAASFAGEEYYYDPRFTVIVQYRANAVMAGVYRTDDMYDLGPDDPSLCLLVMAWDRDKDAAIGAAAYDRGGADLFREYLTRGPQIDTSVVFGSENSLAELRQLIDTFVDEVTADLTLMAARSDSPTKAWEAVSLHMTDPSVHLEYTPWVTSYPALEERIPGWLDAAVERAKAPGIQPDGTPKLAVHQSVAELLTLPVRPITPYGTSPSDTSRRSASPEG